MCQNLDSNSHLSIWNLIISQGIWNLKSILMCYKAPKILETLISFTSK